MILRSIWTVFKNAILHTNEVSKISPATKSLFCSDFLLDIVETYKISLLKFGLSEKHTKFEKNLPGGLDVY